MLSLLVTICVEGVVGGGVCVWSGTLSSETEDLKEIAEDDDTSQFWSIDSHDVMSIHGQSLDEWMQTVHDGGLSNQSWFWRSPGPTRV